MKRKEEEGRGLHPLKIKRPFQIGTSVCIGSIFIFTWHQFSPVLYSFHSNGYIFVELRDFIWRSGDVVLSSAFMKISKVEEDCQKRRECFSSLEDAGRSSGARLGKLINLFIRRINIVTASRLAVRLPLPYLSYRLSFGRWRFRLGNAKSCMRGRVINWWAFNIVDIPSFNLVLPTLHYSGCEYKQLRSCCGKGNSHYALIVLWDSDLENRFCSCLVNIENTWHPHFRIRKYYFLKRERRGREREGRRGGKRGGRGERMINGICSLYLLFISGWYKLH